MVAAVEDQVVRELGTVTVVSPGVQTTVQDVYGRTGYWDVGVPPSGAFDELSLALAQAAVGNADPMAGLECVVTGPVLQFDRRALVCLTGAASNATVTDATVTDPGHRRKPVRVGQVTAIPAGATLDVGPLDGPGMRGYIAIAGGLTIPIVLGSRATFILGQFGGCEGRPLVAGDVLDIGPGENLGQGLDVTDVLPVLTDSWTLRVIPGPHGAPEHLTVAGVQQLFQARWLVDHRADRTGIRLVGPSPLWARQDGGEAGIHPSNVHDSAYPVGGIMLSGDTPVIVGKDGPSLGGFVVPAVVIGADRWKLGQLRPGDEVTLLPVTPVAADAAMAEQRAMLADLPAAVSTVFRARLTPKTATPSQLRTPSVNPDRPPALHRAPVKTHTPSFAIRRSGDRHLLVEAGPSELDLTVRVWIHLLAQALRSRRLVGVTEIVEGVRSVLIAVDDSRLPLPSLAETLAELATTLDDPAAVVLQTRQVTLPIAFDHPEAHEAMRRYQASVNPTAPWCPDNVEFIRRVNDLDERAEVFDIVKAASWLVVGLGDVYLGAPVAVPIDPRHRLVTTKYNPARTWTPQNAVGIGGIYLCVYGMEGPGGYQLVGRTVPVFRISDRDEQPWLLRQFDRIRFIPVSAAELADQRADIKAGRADLQLAPATFSIREVTDIEQRHAPEIAELRARRRAAFDAERRRWSA